MRWYRKRHKFTLLLVTLSLWMVFHLVVSLLRFGFNMTQFQFLQVTIFAVVFATGMVFCSLSDLPVCLYARRLKKGIPQPNRRPYRLAKAGSGLASALYAVIVVCAVLNILSGFLTRYNPTRPIEEFETPPPYVALEVLDPEAVPDRSEAGPISNPFAVSAWRTVEEQWGERLEDGGYAPDIARCETRYYRMRAGFLASAMEKLLSGGASMEETDCPGGTRALRGTNAQGEQLLILRRGTQVMSVRYSGSGDLREHLEEAAERMENEE